MKKLVCIDIETTGLDKKNDHIIQLSAVKINSETFEEIDSFKSYVKPLKDFTIVDEAFEKHGLSKVFILEQGKTIKEIGQNFIDFIEDCDILSYNGMSFDIAFIDKDFLESGISIDWSKYKSIDVYSIECMLNSRKLEDVYKKYTGNDLINAHDALSDVRATIEVYKHQKNIISGSEYNQDAFIVDIISPDNVVKYDKNNQLVFTIGKYRGVDVYRVCKTDPQYIKWLFENGISETTKNSIKEYYKSIK
jgi:DNA polymerase-3 subunit epsilon